MAIRVDGVSINKLDGKIAWKPSGDLSLTASSAIAVKRGIMRLVGAGSIVLTSTPSLVDGIDGQIVILQGTSDTNMVKLQDEAQLASSGLRLTSGADFTLGKGDTLMLIYDAGDDLWYELSRSDN